MSEQQVPKTGSIESQLDGIGTFYLALSGITAIVLFIYSLSGNHINDGIGYWSIVISIGIILQGVTFWILLKAGAEIIRLLKYQNKLPYAGKISAAPVEDSQCICNACNTPAAPDAKYCTNCGAEFEEEETV